VAYYKRINSKLFLNNFKEVEENIPAPSRNRKRKRLQKTPLFIKDSVKTTVTVRGVSR